MMSLTIKLLVAHILGDFVLQPNHWVKSKKKKAYKSIYFYLHGGVHLLSLLILLGFDLSYWRSIGGIVLSHLLIDLCKVKLERRLNPRLMFGLDQLLHLCVIGGVIYYHTGHKIDFWSIYSTELLLAILALLMVTSVSSVVVKTVMSKWKLEEDKSEDSLESAGKYIGILERLFVFGFILLHQWSAIGLLIAAKSVFRFSDLSRAKDRKLTEYILIGTLISFGLAILIGLCVQYMYAYIRTL
jgi:hypothetical protein